MNTEQCNDKRRRIQRERRRASLRAGGPASWQQRSLGPPDTWRVAAPSKQKTGLSVGFSLAVFSPRTSEPNVPKPAQDSGMSPANNSTARRVATFHTPLPVSRWNSQVNKYRGKKQRQSIDASMGRCAPRKARLHYSICSVISMEMTQLQKMVPTLSAVRGGREGGCVPVSRREEEEPCGKSKETGRGPGLWATAGSRLPRTTGGPDGHATGHRKGSSEGEKLHDSPPKGALLRVVFNVPPPKDLERFLSQRRVTELRRTELMHKRWTEREWLPLQRRVEERASTRGPAALKRRRSSYSHYLHHCNTKGFVFLDIFDLREYNPFRGDIKTPPLIKLSTGDLEEPHDRLEERGTPGSCEAGCKYTRKQVERRPQGDPPLCLTLHQTTSR
ncbi:protein FAM228A isoform 2-T3 [Spinachia spinachia]